MDPSKSKAVKYYKNNKDKIEFAKKNCEPVVRAMARVIEKLAKKDMEESQDD